MQTIVILAEVNLQTKREFMENWCAEWRMKIDISKSNVIDFRNSRNSRTSYQFLLETQSVEVVKKYKYLGLFSR